MPETFRSSRADTIADLMRQKGRVGAEAVRQQGQGEAQRALASGQAWGNAIQNIGQTVSGSLKDYADYRQDEPNRLLRQRQSDRLAQELSAMETEQATAQIGKLAQMVQASNYDPSTAEPIFRAIGKLSPEYAEPLMRSLTEPGLLKQVTDTLIQQTPGYKAPAGFELGEGQTRFDASGKPIASVPKSAPPPKEPEPFTLSEGQVRYGPDGTPVASGPAKPAPADALEKAEVLLDGRPAFAVFNKTKGTYSVNGQDVSDRVKPIPPKESVGPRSPIWVIGPDGQFKDLAGVAPPGSKPASTREQGRPVTSGDAGRIADLDTSLNDLGVLASTVTGSTGTSAKVGAMLPNWVTELTGRGVSAKQKQAAIDRVKQVIGKALEGGVLRKEDELKYEKILPTIYDPPDVVTAKLSGLQSALVQRRQTTLDALADAGYDVSKYTARTPAPAAPKDNDPLGIRK